MPMRLKSQNEADPRLGNFRQSRVPTVSTGNFEQGTRPTVSAPQPCAMIARPEIRGGDGRGQTSSMGSPPWAGSQQRGQTE